MKTLAILLCTTCILQSKAQLSAGISAGYSTKTVDLFVSPAVNYTIANTVTLTTELMINVKMDAPVNFGFKGSYQYRFIEVGAGIWGMVYSLDGINNKGQFDNKMAGSVFAAANWKKFFLRYEYLEQSKISIGVRETF